MSRILVHVKVKMEILSLMVKSESRRFKKGYLYVQKPNYLTLSYSFIVIADEMINVSVDNCVVILFEQISTLY